MVKVGVVVPVLSQYKMAVDLLASLRSEHSLEVFVIPQYRDQLPLAGAWNRGADECWRKKCDFALICNDDILLSPFAIDNMVEALCDLSWDGILVSGQNARGLMAPDDVLTVESKFKPERSITGGPDFACFMITRETVALAGRFDENFYPAYFEDNDYHRRIILAGYEASAVPAATMYHYGSQTQIATGTPVVPSMMFEKNRAYFVQKWGGVPGHETFTVPFNDPTKTIKDW